MKTNQLIEALRPALEDAVKRAVIDALTVEITWEKVRDEKTGLPLAAVERRNERVFLPAFFCQHLKFHEGAARGLHEDVSKKNNMIDGMAREMAETGEKLKAIGQALIGMETTARVLAALLDRVKQRYPSLRSPAFAMLEEVQGDDDESKPE